MQQQNSPNSCMFSQDTINKALYNQQYCTAVFLDVSQAFDNVWLPGLLFKLKNTSALRLIQPPEIVLTRQTFHNKIQQLNFGPLPNTFRCPLR
jgi:hypothetical protein